MNPLVSIIIVNFNKKEYLAQALDGLRIQSFHDFEIIVVDNGSTDDSASFILREFPDIKLIALDQNTGFARGNNIAIAQAQGEFIALLNNDAVPSPDWLNALVAAAQRHPQASFFASQVELFYEPGLLDSAGDSISTAGTVYRRGHRQSSVEYLVEEHVFGAQACAAFYRRSAFAEVGLFDEDFFCVYEDADWSTRAQLTGHRCVYVPSARVRHRGGSTLGRFSTTYVYYGHRNVEYLFIKDLPAALLLKTLPAHLVYNLMAFVFFTTKRQGLAFLRAKWDVVKALPELRVKRRVIQSSRTVSTQILNAQLHPDWVPRIVREKAHTLLKNKRKSI